MVLQACVLHVLLCCHQCCSDTAILQFNIILQRSSGIAGELYDQIQKRKQIEEHDARIYAAEIVLMLDRLRQEKVSLLSVLICCIDSANDSLAHHDALCLPRAVLYVVINVSQNEY